MNQSVEHALSILDAGKAVRVAEQELSSVPVNPPPRPPAEAPTDHRAIAGWRERHMDYDRKLREWQQAKAQAEAKLEQAAEIYIDNIMHALWHDIEEHVKSAIESHMHYAHGREVS